MGLRLIEDFGTTISLLWTAHDNADCIPLLTYYIAIFEDGDVLLESNQIRTSRIFNDLTYNTTYTIVVLAAIGNNNGTNATIVVTTTPSGL